MQDTKLKILLNGEKWLSGDAQSMRIVFNCLSGKNFMTHKDYTDYMAGIKGLSGAELAGDILLVTEADSVIDTEVVGTYFNNEDKIALRQRIALYRQHGNIYRSAMAEYEKRRSMPITSPEHNLSAEYKKEQALADITKRWVAGMIDEHERGEMLRHAEVTYQMELMINDLKGKREKLPRWQIEQIGQDGVKFDGPAKPVLTFVCDVCSYEAIVTYQGGSVIEYSPELIERLVSADQTVTYDEYMALQDICKYLADMKSRFESKSTVSLADMGITLSHKPSLSL